MQTKRITEPTRSTAPRPMPASRKRRTASVQTAHPALPIPHTHPGIEYVSASLIHRYHQLAKLGSGAFPAAGG